MLSLHKIILATKVYGLAYSDFRLAGIQGFIPIGYRYSRLLYHLTIPAQYKYNIDL